MTAVDDVCYFSNSTEGEMWMDQWCYRCVHDHNYHPGGNETNPCQHQLSLYVHHYSPVFIKNDVNPCDLAGRWTCIEFSRCPCDRRDDPGEPTPPPPDPNQLALFDITKIAVGIPADIWHDTFTKEPA